MTTCTCYDDGVMSVLGDGCPLHDHRIKPAQIQPIPGPKSFPWRKTRPPDRALLLSNGSLVQVLDYIGPALEWWHSASNWENDFTDTPAGLWIWEGTVVSDGQDSTMELSGSLRQLTDEELMEYKEQPEGPWDENLWADMSLV
jgi:hypothetical protein